MPPPKTVLFVQHYGDGGSVTSLLDLVRGLDPTRYRPVVCFRNGGPFMAEFEAAGITVECLFEGPAPVAPAQSGAQSTLPTMAASPRRRGYLLRKELRRFWQRDLPATRRLVAVARRHGVDLIHANNDVRVNRDALAAAAVLRLPVVVHVRWIYDTPPRLTLAIDRFAARRVARFFFISTAALEAYKPVQNPARRGIVVDNPFNVDDYRIAPPPNLRSQVGVAGPGAVIINVGRLTRWKGQDVLIRAIAELGDVTPPVRVLLIGQASDARGRDYATELEALVTELGLTERVLFLGARRDIPALLGLADVAVHSSTEPEPFGRVVVEAMAAGQPVVASDAGGVPEIIDDGVTGLLVPANQPTRLADAIRGLLADPPAAAAMARLGQRAVSVRFSVEGHASVVQDNYDQVLR